MLLTGHLDVHVFPAHRPFILLRLADRRRKLDQQARTANLFKIQARDPARMLQIATGLAMEIQNVETVVDEN
jgi:hypothetical protein